MKIREIILAALFIILIAIGARIQIPIPVVPFTLQFLFTMLTGLLLGARLGCISVSCYVLFGLLGLPVFAEGGGLGYIFNPSFGYLIGYIAATCCTGYITQKTAHPNYRNLLLANFTGLIILYIFGMVYCYMISNFYLNTPIGFYSLLIYCFLLPIPGDIALCFLAALIAQKLLPYLKTYTKVIK